MTVPAAPSGARHVDLHLHSTASDGLTPPAGVVHAGVAAGVSALALTDHDTVEGIPAAQDAALRAGIELVPGVELSDDELRRLFSQSQPGATSPEAGYAP